MHKQVLAVLLPVAEGVRHAKEKGGHVPASGLRSLAERLERAAQRLRRIASAKEQDPGSGFTQGLPNFFG